MARNYSGVSQGAILRPISLNIFINDLFPFIKEKDVCNTDDTTLYKCGRNLNILSENLEMVANIAIIWLNNNEMVAVAQKFSLPS